MLFYSKLEQFKNELQQFNKEGYFKKRQHRRRFQENEKAICEQLIPALITRPEAIPFCQLLEWYRRTPQLIIRYKYPKELTVEIINTSFTLLAQVSYSRNSLSKVEKLHPSMFPNLLEIHYLLSYLPGRSIAKNFVLDFQAFSRYVGIPIQLFCSEELISYYKKLGFCLIWVNPDSENMMVYFPPTKP